MAGMVDAALEYASRGWRVFPCGGKSGKDPLTPHGHNDACDNPNIIERWWQRYPNANIGCAAGESMGAWVLDVDGDKGSRSLSELEQELGPLPETLEVRTGSGGRHLYFKWSDDVEMRNRLAVRPGIDVRGNGGYVILPPSLHKSGNRYDWTSSKDTDPRSAPNAWRELLRPTQHRAPIWDRATPPPTSATLPARVNGSSRHILERGRLYLDVCAPAIQGSGGHGALFWAARGMVRGLMLSDKEALDLLWTYYNPKCVPPWNPSDPRDVKDFERKVVEARIQEFNKPVGWLLNDRDFASEVDELRGRLTTEALLRADETVAPYDTEKAVEHAEQKVWTPFPIDYFPGVIKDYVRQVSDAHCVDESFAAFPVLVVAGAAMGNAWRLVLKQDMIANPILWAFILGKSGVNKSGPVDQIVRAYNTPPTPSQVTSDLACPGEGRKVVKDVTFESMLHRLKDSPRGLLCCRDEVGGWLQSLDKDYSGNSKRTGWMEMHGGGSYIVDRKTDDEFTFIPHAACSVLGTIQPKILNKLFTPDMFDSGFVARVFITCPPKRDSFWTNDVVDKQASEVWSQVLKWLRTRPFYGVGAGGVLVPREVMLDPGEAQAVYERFYDDLSGEASIEKDDRACAILSKARMFTGRLVLIHHGLKLALEGAEDLNQPVGLDSVKAGMAWMRWIVDEQLRVYGFHSYEQRKEEAMEFRALIAEKSPTGKGCTVREFMRYRRKDDNDKAWKAKANLDKLVKFGFAKWDSDRRLKVTLL